MNAIRFSGCMRKKGTTMGEITANVNWLAVIVGAVVAFLLGWLWYSPKLFGTQWAKDVGVELGRPMTCPWAPW